MWKSDTDKIIGAGLVGALIFYILVVGVIAFFKDVVLPLDVASNIVTGLAGYMGRSLLEKIRKEEHDDNSVTKPAERLADSADKTNSA